MAREMHLARIAVDWWTLGILLFEFMAGHPPFESPTPVETYSKVMMLACNSIGIYTSTRNPKPDASASLPVQERYREGEDAAEVPRGHRRPDQRRGSQPPFFISYKARTKKSLLNRTGCTRSAAAKEFGCI